MKSSKLFITSLLAAATSLSVPAFGEGSADVIQINFYSNASDAVSSSEWNDESGGTQATAQSLNFTNGDSSGATVTWSSSGNYQWEDTTNVMDVVLKGYLDDGGSGVSINVSNISYLVYDVTIIAATDTANAKFSSKTVNGITYTSDGNGNAVYGSSAWGASRQLTVGNSNSFTVSSLGGDLSISSVRADTSTTNRGCIAGLVITNTGGTAVDATLSADAEWTSTSLAGTAWTNATDDNRYLAHLTLGSSSTLNVTGTDISTTAIIATTAADDAEARTLTLSGNAVSLIGPAVVRTDSTTASIVVNNTLNFAAGGKISGNVSTGTGGSLNVTGGTLNVYEATDASALAVALSTGAVLTGVTGTDNSTSGATDLTKVSGSGKIEFAAAGNTSPIDGDSDAVKAHNVPYSWVTLSNNFTGTLSITSGVVDMLSSQGHTSEGWNDGNSSAINTDRLGGTTLIELNGGGLQFRNATGSFDKNISVASGNGAIRVYSEGNVTLSGEITGAGTLTHTDGGTLTLAGTVNLTGGFTNAAGTTKFTGNTTIGTLNVSGASATFSGASTTITTANITGGTLNLNGTTTVTDIRQGAGTLNINGTTTATSLVLSHTNAAGALSVGRDGVLLITGDSNSTGGSAGSFMIGNYPQTNTVTVDGVINLQNAGITVRDGNGEITVRDGGEVNFNAGLTVAANNNRANAISLTLNEGGRINIGGTTSVANSNVLSLTLNGGTIGSLVDSWTSAQAMTIGGAVRFDTVKMAFNETGKATATSETSSMTIGAVDFADGGSLEVTGGGSLTLNGVVSGVTAADTTAKITIGTGSTLTLGTGFIYAMTGDDSQLDGKTLNLATVNGTLAGTLSSSNFTLNGHGLSTRTNVSFDASDGTVTFSGASYDLFWKSGTTTWNATTEFDKGSVGSGTPATFVTGDDVTFDTGTELSVTVSSAVTAKIVTIASGTVTFTTSKVTAQEGFVVENGATLQLATSSSIGGDVTVKTGGTLDLNGNSENLRDGGLTSIILAGGKLYGGDSSNVGGGKKQFDGLRLTADSTIEAAANTQFGLVASGWGAVTVDLGGHKLTKTGEGTFGLASTTLTAGTIQVDAGTLQVVGEGGTGLNGSAADFIVNENGTLSVQTKSFSAKTLSGSGLVTLSGAGSMTVTTFGNTDTSAAWTGTVRITDKTQDALSLANYGTSGSAVELQGFSGYFSEQDNGSFAGDLVLTNSTTSGRLYAAQITNGNSDKTLTLSGKISGDGLFSHSGAPTQIYKFTGDVSGFTGTLQSTTATFKFAGTEDQTFAGTLYGSSTTTDGVTTITGGKMAKEGSTKLTITGSANVSSLTISGGSVEVTGSGVLTGTISSLAAGSSLKLAGTGDTASAVTLSGTAFAIGANSSIAVEGNSSLSGTIGTMGAGSSLTLAGTGATKSAVTISGAVGSAGKATINISNGNGVNYTNTASQGLWADITISGAGSTFTQAVSSANTADMLKIKENLSISVSDGGTLALGQARWEICSTTINLDGGNITGTYNGNDSNKYGNLDFGLGGDTTDTYSSETVYVTQTHGQDSTISASIRLRSGKIVTFDVAENATLNITGQLSAAGTFVKSSTGTVTFDMPSTPVEFAGAEAFTGSVDINAGKVVVKNSAVFGKTTATTSRVISVAGNAALQINLAGGALDIGTTGVTFNEGSKFLIDLTGVSVEENRALTIISSSAISFNSTPTGSLTSEIIESYFDAGNSVLGDYSTWLRDWSYDTTNGLQLTLTIPEPSTFGLLAGLGALAIAGTRRRRKNA